MVADDPFRRPVCADGCERIHTALFQRPVRAGRVLPLVRCKRESVGRAVRIELHADDFSAVGPVDGDGFGLALRFPVFVPEQVADEQKAADGYGERGDQKE